MNHSTSNNNYCSYYQATIAQLHKTWFIVATLKSFDHLAFDRAVDGQPDLFEFFVPVDREAEFLAVMKMLVDEGVVHQPIKKENRLVPSAGTGSLAQTV